MLTICHYTTGPAGQMRHPAIGDESMRLNKWFLTADREDLACTKSITLEAYKTRIHPRLPAYWQDFSPFLERLVRATWKDMPYLEHPNIATHEAYSAILLDALRFFEGKEKPSPYPTRPVSTRLPKRPPEVSSQEQPSKTQCGNQGTPIPLPLSRMHHFESFDDDGRV